MNRPDAEKWASALKYSSRPDVSRQDLIDKLLEEFNAPSSVRCHVCKSPLNGETCPKCQPIKEALELSFEGEMHTFVEWAFVSDGEIYQDTNGRLRRWHAAIGISLDKVRVFRPKCQPEVPAGSAPDVSELLLDGKRVEIAEPAMRIPAMGEPLLYNGEAHYRTSEIYDDPRWILRIKEQPPLSVYGCDPREVDLSQLRGPNGRPVEWVDFRVVDPQEATLFVAFDKTAVCKNWGRDDFNPSTAMDERRIIVREVEERKPRRFICEEVVEGRFHRFFGGEHEDVNANALRPLADLDDPKVVNSVLLQSNWNLVGSIHDQAKSLIQAYLEYPCKS